MNIRFYVHGDAQEGYPTYFYCAMCDVHYPAEHFDYTHSAPHGQRYKQSLRAWVRHKELGYTRPKAPPNVFDHRPDLLQEPRSSRKLIRPSDLPYILGRPKDS